MYQTKGLKLKVDRNLMPWFHYFATSQACDDLMNSVKMRGLFIEIFGSPALIEFDQTRKFPINIDKNFVYGKEIESVPVDWIFAREPIFQTSQEIPASVGPPFWTPQEIPAPVFPPGSAFDMRIIALLESLKSSLESLNAAISEYLSKGVKP